MTEIFTFFFPFGGRRERKEIYIFFWTQNGPKGKEINIMNIMNIKLMTH